MSTFHPGSEGKSGTRAGANHGAGVKVLMEWLNQTRDENQQLYQKLLAYEAKHLTLAETITQIERRISILERKASRPQDKPQQQLPHRARDLLRVESAARPLSPRPPSFPDRSTAYDAKRAHGETRSKSLSPRGAVASVFVDWCTSEGKSLISRYNRFADVLRSRISQAEVQRTYLDKSEVHKVFGAKRGSPAEYWIVRMGSETLLLPQPVNEHQFRDLACFEGGAVSPRSLSSITPAVLRQNGREFLLESAGSIS